MAVARTQAKRIPINTDRANDNGLRWFTRACDALDTPVERPAPANADPTVEAFLAAFAVYFAARHMQPAERSAVTQLGGVRKTRADPNSSLSAYYGARRVLGDYGSYLPPMASVLNCLKGLRVQMIEDFGDDCFAHVQAQPWPQECLEAVLAACSRFAIPAWSITVHETFLDVFVFSLSLGCRKAETVRYKLSNVRWLTPDLEERAPTTEWIASIADGAWCCISPVVSKTDYDNTKYGAQRMWFKVDSTDRWNIASRLLARERRRPASPQDRHVTPLFPDPATGSGVSGTTLVSWLDTVKHSHVPSKLWDVLTWHASRVTLASKLVALKQPWERVQTLIRWESVASVEI